MAGWADDPELLATFCAEVEERIASLQAGLLAIEAHPSPRQLIDGLFRDAHTIKGSARMLGLTGVVQVAHRTEDMLGAVRDGRIEVRRDLVDLLLAGCDAIVGALPGVADGVPEEHLLALADALERAGRGRRVEIPTRHHATVTTDHADRTAPDPASDSANDPTAVPPDNEPHPRGQDSVRVASSKVYELLDVVGEAHLDVARVERAGGGIDTIAADHGRWLRALRDELSSLPDDVSAAVQPALTRLVAVDDQLTAAARTLREVTEGARTRLTQVRDEAMGLAMLPVARVVAGLPRVVRDVASQAGKQVRLVVVGEDVELDMQVLDGVSDALKHLVVNAVDHGCEPTADRLAAGKSAEATVTVAARAAGSSVVIEVSDDGAGIDDHELRTAAVTAGLLAPQDTVSGSALHELLFQPAFSTAHAVTELSGRGVGLDVVRAAVERLGGIVEVRTERGAGTTFLLTLPVTLGVMRCLLARVGDERYALPVQGVVESLSLKGAVVHSLAGTPVVVRHGVTLPLLSLGDALGAGAGAGAGVRAGADGSPGSAVVVRHGDRQVAWAVDALDGERELVVKDLGSFLGRPPAISGATIDGDGAVMCLVDLRELTDDTTGRSATSFGAAASNGDRTAAGLRRPTVLVVEDSVGVRELERTVLEAAGYDVTTAIDGTEGAARLSGDPVDLVLSDVEMPGIDGFELTRTIRRTQGWEQVPVVIMTSRGSEADQRAGLDAGASAYLRKSDFDQTTLVETVRRLVGR